MRRVVIHTDGGCYGKLCKGSVQSIGAGIVMRCEGFREEFVVPLGFGTSQVAELLAIYVALSRLNEPEALSVTVVTDSQYAIGVLTNPLWCPKANQKIIEKTRALIVRCAAFNMQWVKGHADDIENKRADYLASLACGRRAACRNNDVCLPEDSMSPTTVDYQREPHTTPI